MHVNWKLLMAGIVSRLNNHDATISQITSDKENSILALMEYL